MKRHLTLLGICSLLVLTIPGRGEEPSVAARLAKIPAPASESLRKAAGSGAIERVSIEKDGKTTVYEAAITRPGMPNREVSVTADGKLNAEEETVPLTDVPESARKAIEAGAKGAKIERVQRIRRANGEATYEALYVSKGKKREVEYRENGTLRPEEK